MYVVLDYKFQDFTPEVEESFRVQLAEKMGAKKDEVVILRVWKGKNAETTGGGVPPATAPALIELRS